MTAETDVRTLTAALSAPFDPKEIKFKPQMVKNNRALAMAYIDARLIQDRLDEVVGVENWEDAYKILTDGSVMCRLRVKLGDRWITKCDVGSPSEQPDVGDRLKAAFSDALKRAAVKFGVGRYLYRLSAQWVDYDAVKKQLVQLPQLPAFALPKGKAAKPDAPKPPSAKVEAPAELTPTRSVSEGAATPTRSVSEATPTRSVSEGAPKTNLPANGQELHRRLRDYDTRLAEKKLCNLGALLAHVTQAGVKAGYTANMAEWNGPAIPFAVDAVKDFETTLKKAEARPAA
jgi:hypothetical protein